VFRSNGTRGKSHGINPAEATEQKTAGKASNQKTRRETMGAESEFNLESSLGETGSPKRWLTVLGIAGGVVLGAGAAPLSAQVAPAEGKKPNILVIWGDDIGVHNISAYNHGIMGYKTPNIDRIAAEGALFTDAYAQQSSTAGRASFILGQHPFRTGLLTIGMPGSPHGIPQWMPPSGHPPLPIS
jgi:arylsulfatase